ncbi:unannotated protein [freshwater metagenome]|uniref:Unannotated protein n=1 Tax=freshwater metagenome TaxID=449393 RepID=A0A6J6LXT0_9ZZZZ
MRVSIVPINPLSRPASDIIWCKIVVTVVFPFVPVIPTLYRSRIGSLWNQALSTPALRRGLFVMRTGTPEISAAPAVSVRTALAPL